MFCQCHVYVYMSICNQENFVVCKDLTNVDILEPVLHFLFISFLLKEIIEFPKSWKKMFVYKIHELQIFVQIPG